MVLPLLAKDLLFVDPDDKKPLEEVCKFSLKHKVDESFGEYCRAAVFSDVVNSDGRLLAK